MDPSNFDKHQAVDGETTDSHAQLAESTKRLNGYTDKVKDSFIRFGQFRVPKEEVLQTLLDGDDESGASKTARSNWQSSIATQWSKSYFTGDLHTLTALLNESHLRCMELSQNLNGKTVGGSQQPALREELRRSYSAYKIAEESIEKHKSILDKAITLEGWVEEEEEKRRKVRRWQALATEFSKEGEGTVQRPLDMTG
ncbi:hypothetical protein I302_105639 [Kwoniella bestiolae CBS 10118]|uniref:Uncharacterized protein n=1 Tax=Kwoniella bestiolae CBS 10118 TaxID=1296100 RepID=A0A1B9G1P7_9TREE|nr:hypothetical protein I302_04757 [Kwoniella bestiolae CBS 10118]OCF24947.1 hypothetical protein I302_04757 [Kwoniella bestiolae CBS 10118]